MSAPVTSSRAPAAPRLTAAAIALFAVSVGLIVANLYYAQPLLPRIASAFGVSVGTAARLVTWTQLGYAAGLALIVPLGDAVDRRKLTLGLTALSVLALLGVAAAPVFWLFSLASVLLGLTSVAAQVLVPFAASLASPERRGQVVGTVMSGLLLGILLARTVSGLLSAWLGWRMVFVVAAGALVLLLLALWRQLPRLPAPPKVAYGALLASVVRLLREEPVLRRRSLYGLLAFAAFSVFWTSLAFLLAGPPYFYHEAVAGLFGLVGALGALAASWAGHQADAGKGQRTTGLMAALIAASFGLVYWGGTSLWALIAGALLMDLGVQGLHITNQSEIYKLHPDARSRVTTVYLTSYFAGGVLGSALSSVAYVRFGWAGVSALGAAFGLSMVLLWWQARPQR
ncbi:MFS transporter [Deinococcus rubellus]|uniref:MFS transporter n=1 Tax=Deinococcus rubellus TaxID=1889240 RepID=A0ABY5YFI9_9DEIO|nr:MFS transporter [Deinococcus rubellus]UWX63813.1 MFS transporter [Deinococcus rubellus]